MSTGTKYQWPRRQQSWFNLSNELELSNELKRVSSSTGYSRFLSRLIEETRVDTHDTISPTTSIPLFGISIVIGSSSALYVEDCRWI